jgi:hypothetical protein
MRKLLWIIIAGIGLSNFANAQSKYGQDSAKCRDNLYIYYELAKAKNYDEAYSSWKIVYDICPASSKNNFIYGPRIVKAQIKAAADEATKQEFIKLLMEVYDNRLVHFPGKEDYVKGAKALDMIKYKYGESKEAYDLFISALEVGDQEQSAAFFNGLFVVSARLFNEKVFTSEDVFNAYNIVIEGIEVNNNRLNRSITTLSQKEEDGSITNKEKKNLAKAQRELARYDDVETNAEKIIGKIATCDRLTTIYNDETFEANKTDKVWLKRASKMLLKERRNPETGEQDDCSDNPVFFKIAEALYQLEPSISAARAMGRLAYKNKDFSKSADYFNEAATQEVDPKKSSKDYLTIAVINQKLGKLASAKTAALKAASLRKNWGDPYIVLATVYAAADGKCGANVFEKKAVYWAAIDKLNYAKSIDRNAAPKANKLIAAYKKSVPDKGIAFQLGHEANEKYTIGCWINETVTVTFY